MNEYLKNQNFGQEPLEKDFTLKKFNELLKNKKRGKIKQVLIDQKFISGIGNIYAAEICFYAKISPVRDISKLTEDEIKNLYKGIKEILTKAIKYKGSSVDNYADIYGNKGLYVPHLKVYNRKEKKCFRCGEKIKLIKLAGRGTYFCPKCQK